jgi:hypothetical protein
MKWLQCPNQSTAYNLNNVRPENDRHFRNKRRKVCKLQLMNLKLTVRSKILGTFIAALKVLGSINKQKLI